MTGALPRRVDLAILFMKRKEFATSENYFKRALATFEAALGTSHPDLADCLDSYAELLRQTGRSSEAESLTQRAASIRAERRSS